MITQKQYVAGECSHQEYYTQFANKENTSYVVGFLGRDRLLKDCKTFYLNEIPLYEFHRMFALRSMTPANSLITAGETWCLSTQVCIAKAIIRNFLNENKVVLDDKN